MIWSCSGLAFILLLAARPYFGGGGVCVCVCVCVCACVRACVRERACEPSQMGRSYEQNHIKWGDFKNGAIFRRLNFLTLLDTIRTS